MDRPGRCQTLSRQKLNFPSVKQFPLKFRGLNAVFGLADDVAETLENLLVLLSRRCFIPEPTEPTPHFGTHS